MSDCKHYFEYMAINTGDVIPPVDCPFCRVEALTAEVAYLKKIIETAAAVRTKASLDKETT
jgi:hypothetical protein